MDAWIKILLLYAMGALVLGVDVFVPSYGVLLVVGLGLLGFGLYEAFSMGMTIGMLNLVGLLIALPTGAAIVIKYWHRTPIGRRISPPNPTLSESDRLPVSDLESIIGNVGRSVTMLRPVGTCVFDGRRIECKAEYGVIASGVEVEALRLSDRTMVVRAADTQSPSA